MSFEEWLERCKRYRQEVLGLDGDISSHIWVIKGSTETSWDLSVQYQRDHHAFSAAFIIFCLDDGLFYVTHKQAQGVITRALLKPIGMIDYLVFPWETQQEPLRVLRDTCRYRITWMHDAAPTDREPEDLNMANVEKRLRARDISELNPCDAASRGYCDVLFELLTDYPHLGKKRAEVELLSFWEETSRLSEKATLKWLKANGVDLHQYWVPPTTRDIQLFLQRFPDVAHPNELPSGCFEMPYEDAPSSAWPLYRGGTCHLTYRDMPAWAWQHYERFKERTKRMCAEKRDAIIESDERIRYLLGEFWESVTQKSKS